MSLEQAWAFVVFATVAAITPGPSNVMLTVTGMIVGILRGIPCLGGVAIGMGFMMMVVALGLGSVVLAYPVLLSAMKWFGAAFLLWLAWKIATSGQGDAPDRQKPVGFVGAFVFQWINPKSWLVSTSAVGTFLQPSGGIVPQALAIGGLFFLVASSTGFLWLSFGVVLRRLLKQPRFRRAFNVLMALLLAASVVWIVR